MIDFRRRLVAGAVTSLVGAVPLQPALAAVPVQDDIRDIHGPIAVPVHSHWEIYLYAALVVIGVFLLLWKLWRWYRSRPQSPYQLAQERLVMASESMTAERSGVFCDEVSECVRSYVESTFLLPMTRVTTDEFLAEMTSRAQENSTLVPYKDELQGFLLHCDVAKFAGRQMSPEVMGQLLEHAHHFIDSTHRDLQDQAKSQRRRHFLGRFLGRRSAEGTT